MLNIIYHLTGDCAEYFNTRSDHFTVVKIDELNKHSPADIIKNVHNPGTNDNIFDLVETITISSVSPFANKKMLYDNFPGDKMCAEKWLLNLNAINFTGNCSIVDKGKLIENVLIQVTIDREKVTQKVYKCNRYYLNSGCLLRLLNHSKVTIDDEKDLYFEEDDGMILKYAVEEYTPLKGGHYGVCIKTGKHKVKTLSAFGGQLHVAESYIYLSLVSVLPPGAT